MKTKFMTFTGLFITIFLAATFGLTKPSNEVNLDKKTDSELGRCTYVFTTNWDSVEFEVRAGNEGRCDDRAFVGTYVLYKGESIKLYQGNGLCWRRRANPRDRNSNWTNWTNSVMCTGGKTIKVSVR